LCLLFVAPKCSTLVVASVKNTYTFPSPLWS
jgi:hypothetical protein